MQKQLLQFEEESLAGRCSLSSFSFVCFGSDWKRAQVLFSPFRRMQLSREYSANLLTWTYSHLPQFLLLLKCINYTATELSQLIANRNWLTSWDGQGWGGSNDRTLCLKRFWSPHSLRLRSMKKCVALVVSSGVMSHTIRKESQVTSQIWILQGVERGASISVICHETKG